MEDMIAAKYNIYWYLSFIIPAVVMLLFTFWKNKKLLTFAVIISLTITYTLCNISVQEKWKVRGEIAQTEKGREYAMADGANLVFTAYFIAPFEAILYTSTWGILGWTIWPRIRRKRNNKVET